MSRQPGPHESAYVALVAELGEGFDGPAPKAGEPWTKAHNDEFRMRLAAINYDEELMGRESGFISLKEYDEKYPFGWRGLSA